MKRILFLYTIVSIITNYPLAAQTKEVLTNKSIIELHKAGLEENIITSKIETSKCKFDITTTGLITLKKEGISGEVIEAMISKAEGKKEINNNRNTSAETKPPTSNSSVPEPDLINYVHLYDKALKKITPLERSSANLRSQKKMLGYGGVNFVYEISGDKSSVRFNQNEIQSFIVNAGNGSGDIFILYKLEIKKKSRQAVASNFSSLGDMKGSKGVITTDIKMLKPGIYEIIPRTALEKGEYFFANKSAGNAASSNADVNAFGVD